MAGRSLFIILFVLLLGGCTAAPCSPERISQLVVSGEMGVIEKLYGEFEDARWSAETGEPLQAITELESIYDETEALSPDECLILLHSDLLYYMETTIAAYTASVEGEDSNLVTEKFEESEAAHNEFLKEANRLRPTQGD